MCGFVTVINLESSVFFVIFKYAQAVIDIKFYFFICVFIYKVSSKYFGTASIRTVRFVHGYTVNVITAKINH